MNAQARILSRPDWPRLLSESDAAAYLSIGTTMLREHGPRPKSLGRRVLWDRRDLDRWVDALDGQPLDGSDAEAEARETERRWLERRKAGKPRG